MTDRDELAEFHATCTAPWLAWAVQVEASPGMVAELLEPLDRQSLYALAVALASQVPRPRSRPDDGVVDEVAVERAAAGHVGPLTPAEREAAVRLMFVRRVPMAEIQRRLRLSGKTVGRLLGPAQERQSA